MFLEAETGADLAKLEVGVERAAAVAPDPVLVVLLRLVATHLDTGYSISSRHREHQHHEVMNNKQLTKSVW